MVSILRESRFKAMVNSLSKVIIELFEVLFLDLFLYLWVLKQRIRHIVRSHSVKQKLNVRRIIFTTCFFTLFLNQTDVVPECIADKGIAVLRVDEYLYL